MAALTPELRSFRAVFASMNEGLPASPQKNIRFALNHADWHSIRIRFPRTLEASRVGRHEEKLRTRNRAEELTMGFFENMKSEPVTRLNLRDPVLAKASEPVRDVVKKMKDRQLGCAVLVNDEKQPTAMFTESMLTQLMASQPDALADPIGDHASDHWPQVNLDDKVVTVLEALDIKNIRFLSVVDKEGRIAGLTGQKGLMEYVADHFPSQVMVQRVGQKPFMQKREGA